MEKHIKIKIFGILLTVILFLLQMVAAVVGGEFNILLKRGIWGLFPYIFIFLQINTLTNYYVKFQETKEFVIELIVDKCKKHSNYLGVFDKSYLIYGFLFGIIYLLFSYDRYITWHQNPQLIEIDQYLYYTSLPLIYYSLLFWFIIYFILGVVFKITLTSVRELSKIGRQIPIEESLINPYSLDRCGNLSNLSDLLISLVKCYSTGIILSLAVFFTLKYRWFDFILIVVSYTIIALSFFSTQYGLHKTLKKRKINELDKLSKQLQPHINRDVTNQRRTIKNLFIIQKINEIEKMNLWVLTSKSLHEFGTNFMTNTLVLIIGIFIA